MFQPWATSVWPEGHDGLKWISRVAVIYRDCRDISKPKSEVFHYLSGPNEN